MTTVRQSVPSTNFIMADVAAKKCRSQAKSNFTRAITVFNNLVNAKSPLNLVTKQFDKVMSCWEKLEAAQDEFTDKTEIDVDSDANGVAYLDEPGLKHAEAMNSYSTYLTEMKTLETTVANAAEEQSKQMKVLERDTKFNSMKAEIESIIETFNGVNINIKDSLEDATDEVKREEWNKIKTDFNNLQSKVVTLSSIDPTKDIQDVKDKFTENAQTVYTTIQSWILTELKTTSSTSGGTSASSSSSTSSASNSGSRRETVPLPSFKGEAKYSPFLQFPVWKKSWDSLIVDYEERFHYCFLAEHLDDTAKSKFIGSENDYAAAMKKLENFYGHIPTVIKCVMDEVLSQSEISEGQYNALVSYSDILANNYNRLLSLHKDCEHEMSNSSTMSIIMNKFPRNIREKWEEYLIGLDTEAKIKPFGEFIVWLSSQKEIWQRMASSEKTRCSEGDCTQLGFYGDSRDTVKEKSCHKCGKKGHMKRECPKNNKKKRDATKFKKYWCALHRDDATRSCYSNSCQELRRLEPNERLKLLKENKACKHCCGDHKTDDCPRKERVCGGGKENRGCTKNHNLHELFCAEAKVFAVQHVLSANCEEKSEPVVLLILKVPTLKKCNTASVFWDTGCTSNFIKDDFAKQCGFRGKEVTLNVTTLGGVVTDYKTVLSFRCSLLDTNGYIHYFEAYGMDSITGSVSKIAFDKLKQLFPHSSDESLHVLERGTEVDVLIGLGMSSWQPERDQKAIGGGDLWIWRNMFGACVGGRHPNVIEQTCRNSDLFYVNHVYHVMSPKTQPLSHELEFCARRAKRVTLNDCTLKKSVREVTVEGCTPVKSDREVMGSVKSESVISLAPIAKKENSTMSPHAATFIPASSFSSECVSSDDVDALQVSNQSHAVTVADVISFLNLPTATEVVAERWIENQVHHCVSCNATLTSPFGSEDLFYKAESLGTVIVPMCGECKCSKCPVPGSKYSYKEQLEFDVINNSLFRKEGENRWYTGYPWINGREVLPKNDKSALQSLLSLEKMLKRNPEKAEAFNQQINDMIERGAAILLTDEQVSSWNGPYHYLPMVLVKGKRWRVCFDASRSQCGYPPMNKCLHKGPDRFVNNIASVIIGFRNGRFAAVADISKFHNQIYLIDEDVHMQRFLWRFMNTDIPPQVYAVPCNNFGVTSANCIATCAFQKSADSFSEIYPKESEEIKSQTYIDDQLIAAPTMEELCVKTTRMDEICEHAGMKNKGWTYTGDQSDSSFSIGDEAGVASEKVLGLLFSPATDAFHFNVVLRFKVNSKEVEITSVKELLDLEDLVLTRRNLLSNIARIFDPIGSLCAILLMSRILMREMCSEKGIGWDDPLSIELTQKWMNFLESLLSLTDLKFQRSLWPDAEVEGLPMLIIFSDGSAQAFGAVAYIRWKLKEGGYWTRIIMAKCKIAPKYIKEIPRMEILGALLGNRIKNFILKETNLVFSKVWHLWIVLLYLVTYRKNMVHSNLTRVSALQRYSLQMCLLMGN